MARTKKSPAPSEERKPGDVKLTNTGRGSRLLIVGHGSDAVPVGHGKPVLVSADRYKKIEPAALFFASRDRLEIDPPPAAE